jgi:hypothetical protein
LLRDAIGVLFACGHRTAEAVVGHDSAPRSRPMPHWCAGDIFKRLVLMSAPFSGPPSVPVGDPPAKAPDIHAALAALLAAAQALPVVLLDTARQREHVARQAGRARFPAGLLTITRAPTGKPTSRSH